MFCPNCGKKQSNDAKYCRHCGTKLAEDEGISIGSQQKIHPDSVAKTMITGTAVSNEINEFQKAAGYYTLRKNLKRSWVAYIVVGVIYIIILFILAIAVIITETSFNPLFYLSCFFGLLLFATGV